MGISARLYRPVFLLKFLPILYLSLFTAGCNDAGRDLINKLKIDKSGAGSGRVVSAPGGIDCGGDCSQYYAEDTRVTLTATAVAGSVFTGWSHEACPGTGTCVVTLEDSTTITATFDRTLAGLWQVKGNGYVVDINADESAYDWYEVTETSRLFAGSGRIDGGNLYYRDRVAISLAEMREASERIGPLPPVTITRESQDPEDNFEVFWHTFEQYYAFFDLMTGTSWQALYDSFRPLVTQHTTPQELWLIFSAMIAELKDGHTGLYDFKRGRVASARGVDTSPSHWMMDNLEAYSAVITGYFDSFSTGENLLGNGNMLLGTIDESVGYLNIFAYDGYADRPPEPFEFSLLYLLSAGRRDVQPFAAVLDQVFTRFADMDALVIDLRFNSGGSGDLTKALAARLTADRFLALSHQVRESGYDDYHPQVPHFIEPAAVAFLNKPIVVLTSGNTVSAGDWQALILKALPNVTLMGETTFGIFSEAMPRRLPNGWQFTLSTQRVYDAAGEFYEQKGVSPDIALAPDADLLEEGRDNMLEAALELLGVSFFSRRLPPAPVAHHVPAPEQLHGDIAQGGEKHPGQQ